MFNPGDLIDGRFETIREIGRGGMGVVLEVRDRNVSELVALKYCKEESPDDARRFMREVRVMAGIDHEHVMNVLHHNLEYEPPYFTMPVALNSLDIQILEGLEENQALDIFDQICSGIQAIHSVNGTHRDIKPMNIMCLPDGTFAVSDLGLIKIDPCDTTTLTQTSQFCGTRQYCAPEQLRRGGSRDADVRTDVYQLGKTLYEMLTSEEPVYIDTAKISIGLAHILQQATRENPADRYQSVEELKAAIRGYRLTQNPNASRDPLFESALQETIALNNRGGFNPGNLETLLGTLLHFRDEPDTFLKQFDRIPDDALRQTALNRSAQLRSVIEIYFNAINSLIQGRDYDYADRVAQKMSAVFHTTVDAHVKALAIRSTLIAAVELDRYDAMNKFGSMLITVQDQRVAMAVADVLRKEIDKYASVANLVPESYLHLAIRAVWEEAQTHLQQKNTALQSEPKMPDKGVVSDPVISRDPSPQRDPSPERDPSPQRDPVGPTD